MRRTTRGVLAVLCSILGVGAAWAQQRLCDPTDVRFSVITRDGKLVRGLTVEALTANVMKPHLSFAKVKKQQFSVESLRTDAGPRRLLFIIYTGKWLKSEWPAEIEVVRFTVSSARPEDSFALLTVLGPSQEVQFGASRAAIIGAAQQLLNRSKKKRSHDENTLDAILRGIDWFGEPRPGDSILLLAPGFDWNEVSNYDRVAKALTEHRIRLFSIRLAGSRNWPDDGPGTDQTLQNLSEDSGGDTVFENCAHRHHCQRAEATERMRQEASHFYSAVVETYVARVRFPRSRGRKRWDLDLTEEMRQRVPTASLMYPRWVQCVASGAAGK